MSSIRVFLVFGLMAILILIIFLSALHGYQTSMKEAQKMFDQKLSETTYLLAAVDDFIDDSESLDIKTGEYVFQVWHDNVLLQKSENAPKEAITHFSIGFQHHNFGGYRWRTFTIYNDINKRWTVMAERTDVQFLLAEKVILASVMPVVYTLPLGGLMIWFFVGRGLAPLRNLAKQLGSKRVDDLSPLALDDPPEELSRVVLSTNDLLQRLKASFEREKHFTADAAHELRTPISALRVHLYNLSRDLPADDSNIQHLETAVDRMSHLVEQILQLHRTSPEQFLSKFSRINIFEISQKVVVQEYAQCEEKALQVEMEGGKCVIDGDRFAIETLFQNLFSNACKYTPRGGQILVSIRCSEGFVELEIEDSGPGIPEDQHDRVFDRFYRLDGDRNTSGVIGCGLGMAIVKHIVMLHQAKISLSASSFSSGLSVKVQFSMASSI